MRIHRTLCLLAVGAAFTGCRSNGGAGWSAWNPFSRGGQETAIASSTPELPSQQFADAAKSPASTTAKSAVASATPGMGGTQNSAPTYTPPAAVVRTAAATPTTPNSLATTPSMPATTSAPASRSNSLASGTVVPSVSPRGPYNPNGYQPATMPAATAETAGVNRYGLPDRYAATVPAESPLEASVAPAATPATYPSSAGGRYAAYEPPPATSSPEATAPAAVITTTPAAMPQQVEPASAMVNLTTPTGQYRPAGTSSYATTNSDQVNVASLPEKPVSTTPTTATPADSTPAYPSTGAPEPGSIYGVPSYR